MIRLSQDVKKSSQQQKSCFLGSPTNNDEELGNSKAAGQFSFPCMDRDRQCQNWVNLGYCTNDKMKAHMAVYCKKACNLCSKYILSLILIIIMLVNAVSISDSSQDGNLVSKWQHPNSFIALVILHTLVLVVIRLQGVYSQSSSLIS